MTSISNSNTSEPPIELIYQNNNNDIECLSINTLTLNIENDDDENNNIINTYYKTLVIKVIITCSILFSLSYVVYYNVTNV